MPYEFFELIHDVNISLSLGTGTVKKLAEIEARTLRKREVLRFSEAKSGHPAAAIQYAAASSMPLAAAMISRPGFLACLLILSVPLRAQDAYQAALDSFRQGQPRLALTYLDELSAERIRTPSVQNLRALAFSELGQFEEALAAIHAAQRLDAGNPQYLYNEGLIHYNRKDYATAEEVFRQGLKRFPASAPLYQGLGETLIELHRFGDAELALRKAVSLVPASAGAHAVLAKLFLTLGDSEGLGRASQRALELEPENYLANYYHGMWLLTYQEEPTAAATHLRKASELNPFFSEAHKELGRALMLLDQWQEAATSFQRATALHPKDHQAWYLLAMAFRKLGEQHKASEALDQYKATLRPADPSPIKGGVLRP